MLSFQTKPRGKELPAVDDRLVAADAGYEIFDGVLVAVPPAHEPHASYHSAVDALIRAHLRDVFTVACDMLTRTSELSDIAPDLSVYLRARDPRTGGRQLEQLAFQIMVSETMAYARRRATMLIERGVRRVFAIDLDPGPRALEWSPSRADWEELDPAGVIDDPAFAIPLGVAALLDTAKVDEAIAHALVRRRHHVIEAARKKDRAEGLAAGRAEGLVTGRAEGLVTGRAEGLVTGRAEGHATGRLLGKAETVVNVLVARGIAMTAAERQRVLGETDERRLDRLASAAATCTAMSELLALP